MVAVKLESRTDPFGHRLQMQRRKLVGFTSIEEINSYAGILQLNAQYDESEHWLKKGLALFPNNENAKYLLSLIQLRRGDYRNGFKNWEHRFAVYPENRILRECLAHLV